MIMPVDDVMLQKDSVPLGDQHFFAGSAVFDLFYQPLSGIKITRFPKQETGFYYFFSGCSIILHQSQSEYDMIITTDGKNRECRCRGGFRG